MEEEKLYWLGFSAFPGIGPVRFKLLINYFGSAQKTWRAAKEELLRVGLGEKLVEAFVYFRKKFSIGSYYDDLRKKNIKIITWNDSQYPASLSQITDAPFVLYILGDL